MAELWHWNLYTFGNAKEISMKKLFSRTLLLLAMSLPLFGCSNNPQDEVVLSDDESTIIKDAKSTDGYLEKQDYKSLAYAYIYKIKEGLPSYKTETTGSVKAKVLFFDYDIKYDSVTLKKGSSYYSKDHSVSSLMTIDSEYYMANKEKILVSTEKDKYDVYTTEEFHKISYTVDQYMVMGYVFTDESILGAELLEDKDEVVKVKYTLDNELSTHLVKKDFKNSGGLSEYPTFKTVNVTLAMKRDFTPVSYHIDATYTASKAFLGSTEAVQDTDCVFSEIGSQIEIPNESFLAEKLGATPSTISTDNTETLIKKDLVNALKKLDYKHGINLTGTLALNMIEGTEISLGIDANGYFDIDHITDKSLYNLLGFHANLVPNDAFSSLVSLLKMLVQDKLGSVADILSSLKSLEVVYDENGSLYLIPVNTDDVTTAVGKVKLSDALDLILKNFNLGAIVNGSQNDTFNYKKVNGAKEGDYTVTITLTDEALSSIVEKIESFVNDPDNAIIKLILGYKSFDSIEAILTVKDGALSALEGSVNYIKSASGEDKKVALLDLHLSLKNATYDFAERLTYAEELYNSYNEVIGLKTRLDNLLDHVYVSNAYLAELNKAVEEYESLDENKKAFFVRDVTSEANTIKSDIENIKVFLKECEKYDLGNLDNAAILELAKAYYKNSLKSSLLRGEIGDEAYQIVSDLGSQIDYTLFDSALEKMVGEDETTWGLTSEEIVAVKTIIEISKVISSVNTDLLTKMLLAGKTMTVQDLETKINNLYASLS